MQKKDKRPNIVIFNPDQWRGEALGHAGNRAVNTKNLDELIKKDGVSFVNAFCQNTVCTPSRCSFMSGWYPHVRGHRTMCNMMKPDEPVLLKTLKDNGYFVWWGGKNDLIPGQGPYTDYCDVMYRPERAVEPHIPNGKKWREENKGTDEYYSLYIGKREIAGKECNDFDWAYVKGALEFIKNYKGDKPFCIFLPLIYPHPPYIVEDPWYSKRNEGEQPERIPTPKDWSKKPAMLKEIFEKQGLKNWTEERFKELRAVYYAMCSRSDYQFGLLLDALKAKRIYDDTAVFFFSDHGDYAGDYGIVEKNQNTFEDVLSRVPFIIKPPAWVPVKPGVRKALVELVDFSATVEEICNLKPDHWHFGRSLVPLLTGQKKEHRDAVFCEGGRLHKEKHCMGLESTSAGNKDGLYWPRMQAQLKEGSEHTKAIMCRTKEYKYVMRLYESDELYDLKKDPGELDNKIDSRSYRDIAMNMKDRLLKHFLETCDVVPFQPDERDFPR